MIAFSGSDTLQDTLNVNNRLVQDSVPANNFSDSVVLQDTFNVRDSLVQDSILTKVDSLTISGSDSIIQIKPTTPPKESFIKIDTTSLCLRNSVADITYFQTPNSLLNIGKNHPETFPYLFINKNKELVSNARLSIIKFLKPGQELPARQIHEDWMLGIILIIAFLYTLIQSSSKGILSDITKIFLFRNTTEPLAKNMGGLFHWQSTIQNLISFMMISLFVYSVSTYYNFTPFGIEGVYMWLFSMGVIIVLVTLRHIVCMATGNISGEEEVFKEYLIRIYQSYGFSAIILFIIIILMSYTYILPPGIWVKAGFFLIGIMYLIRVIRLLTIFIKRNISIFYFILYLCALEILPVLICIKYFTGLIYDPGGLL